jgi:hypothetical protein
VASGSNPFFIGVPDIKSGIGSPAASTDPVGSLYMRSDTAELWQQITASGTVPAIVQATSFAGNSGSFSATPAAGDLLIGYCAGNSASVPNAGTGWTDSGITNNVSAAPGIRLTYKFAVSGESTSQSPCSGTNNSSSMVEVSGVANFTASFETTLSQLTSPLSYVTANANDLALAFFARNGSQCLTPGGFTQGLSCIANGTVSTATAAQNFPGFNSTAVRDLLHRLLQRHATGAEAGHGGLAQVLLADQRAERRDHDRDLSANAQLLDRNDLHD